MSYRPPIGRDKEGNKVDPEEARVWIPKTDDWGKTVYENMLTLEIVQEKPEVGTHKRARLS